VLTFPLPYQAEKQQQATFCIFLQKLTLCRRGGNVHTTGTTRRPTLPPSMGCLMSAMMMAKSFPILATTHVHIIMFVTDIGFHGDGVED